MLLMAALWLAQPWQPGSGQVPQPLSVAPDFQQTDLAGHRVSLHGLRGQVVLLTFWATWCGPCLAELPVFAAWQREQGTHGLQVITVAMDDDPAPVRLTVETRHLAVPVLMGTAELARAYGGVLGLPVSFLIDRNGHVRKRYDGAVDLQTLHRDLLTALQ